MTFLRKAFVWFFIAAGLLFLASFFIVPSFAEKKLAELVGGAAYVQSGRLSGLNGIKLKGVVIATDAESLSENPILQADELQIKFKLLHFLSSKSNIGSLSIGGLLLSADYHEDLSRWSFEKLVFKSSEDHTVYLPQIRFQRGALRVRQVLAEQTETITTIGFDGSLLQQGNSNDYLFDLAVDDRFDLAGSKLNGTVTLPIESSAGIGVSLTGSFAMGQKQILNNCWQIERIKLDGEIENQALEINEFSFDMGPGHYKLDGTIGFKENALMNFGLKIKNGRLSDSFEKDALVYAEPVMSYLPDSWQGFLTGYHPAGQLDVDLHFARQPDELSVTNINGTVTCQGLSVLPSVFPYQLEHLQGPLVFQDQNLKLDRLTAKHGDVDVQVDANFEDLGANTKVDLQVQSLNLKLDTDVLAALSESNKKIWFAFSPGGRTAVDYRFQRSKEGLETMKLQLGLENATAVYDQFPYPLENITGDVIVESEQVRLNNLIAAFDDGRKIFLDGQIFNQENQPPNFRIHIQSQNIPVDNSLKGAMPEQQRQLFNQFDLEATADLDVDIFSDPDPGKPMDYIAKIKLNGQRLFYDGFPMEMKDLHLDANVTPEVVYLNRFECVTDGGRVMLDGTLLPKGRDGENPGACLNLNLKEYDFNQTFWDAMGDYADQAFGKLRVSGKMDVVGFLDINSLQVLCRLNDLKVKCYDNPIIWDEVPCGIARGQLHIQGQDVYLDAFSLTKLKLETIPEDWRLGRIKELYTELDPDGQLSMNIDEGKIRIGQGKLHSLDMTGGVDLDGISFGQHDLINKVTGHIDSHLEIDFRKKSWRCLAKYDIQNFLYRHWNVSNLSGQVSYDPEDKMLESENFTARLYEGDINGSFELDLSHPENGTYRLQSNYKDVDLRTFLMAAGPEEQPAKVNTGTAEGSLNLEGVLSDIKQPKGRLVIDAHNLELGEQPLLGKILTAIQFKRPDNFIFSDLEFDSSINGPDLICERIRIVGKPLVFYGNGTLNLDQRQIQASLVGMDKIVGDESSLLNSLARGVGKALWKIEISGDLDNPKIDPVYFSVLKSPLQIFKKKASTPEPEQIQ